MISEEDLEIIAIDIDEEYRLYKKIEEQNREIEENNKDIIWTIENMEYIQREKESQELKSKYHDLLGQSFFMLQQYLNQENLENKNIEDIKFMIRERSRFITAGRIGRERLSGELQTLSISEFIIRPRTHGIQWDSA